MNAYGCDGIADADVERELGFGPDAVDENEIQAVLEERAEKEIAKCLKPFTEWLDDYPEQAKRIAVAVCGMPSWRQDGVYVALRERERQREDNISDALRQLERDYIAYRVNTAPEWERDEIAASIRADREAA